MTLLHFQPRVSGDNIGSRKGPSFSKTWDVLGPFQIGTREAQWGSDPLEYYGGIQALQYDPNATFPSSLAANGTIGWMRSLQETARHNGSATASIVLRFSAVDWAGLRSSYGWASIQFQVWLKSAFDVPSAIAAKFLLDPINILELRIDGHHYFGGDLRGARRAPIVLDLAHGRHDIAIRLIRDTRADGGDEDPTIAASLQLVPAQETLQLVPGSILIADVINDKFATEFASLALTNTTEHDIQVTQVVSQDPRNEASLLANRSICFRPGQTRPVAYRISRNAMRDSTISIRVYYLVVPDREQHFDFTIGVTHRQASHTHKITYLHPSGIVSYAMLRPPPVTDVTPSSQPAKLPILLFLHGAGEEADGDVVSHALDSVADLPAWTLFPSGVTPWSGDDWHSWGFADVESAVAAVPVWINSFRWRGPGVDVSKWLVAGHSNGGQGVWYTLTHRPDNIIAAAPISGYVSVPQYVPYTFWQEAEPFKMAVVLAAMNSYSHGQLVPFGAQDIPIAIQHGSADDNVPTYHSRRMHQIINESTSKSTYSELRGRGHWYQGIETTQFLKDFYHQNIGGQPPDNSNGNQFLAISADAETTGPKFGLCIEDFAIPGRLGKIEAAQETGIYHLLTSNVRRFSLESGRYQLPVIVDGQAVLESPGSSADTIIFEKDDEGVWNAQGDSCRYDNSSPPVSLDAILRTRGHLTILSIQENLDCLALQIARNLMQYYYADSMIVRSRRDFSADSGNIITLSTGGEGLEWSSNDTLRIAGDALTITDSSGMQWRYLPNHDGLGAIFLRPCEGNKRELVVWGINSSSVTVAARLIPLLTGTGQPGFVVLRKRMLRKGLGGVIAMGFFDAKWKAAAATSFFS